MLNARPADRRVALPFPRQVHAGNSRETDRSQLRQMSISRRILFGAAASWFGRGMTIVMGLVLMPVLFRNLPKEELGVWLLLGQTLAGAAVLDLGFGATLTRRIALAKGKSGSDPAAPLNDQSRREIADLITTGRRAYVVLAGLGFVAAWVTGALYLRGLEYSELKLSTALTAWTILCLSQSLLVWAALWTCLLQGVGYIGWEAILATLANTGALCVQVAVVLSGGGLVSLAVVAAVGGLVQRMILLGFARSRRPELFELEGRWHSQVFRTMIGPAARAWVTALGIFLVFNTDQFFISSMEGVAEVPAYRAAFVLVHNLTILAVTCGVASGVFISHLWQAGELGEMHRIVIRNVRLGLLVMLAASAILIVAGEGLTNLWLGPGNFIGLPVLLLFLASETLEVQSYIIATASRATEDEAFAGSALAAGVGKLVLAAVLLPRFGLLGLAAANAIALLLTNHWYMVRRGLKRLQIPVREYVAKVAAPCGAFFICCLAGLWSARQMLGSAHEAAQVIVIVAVAGGMWLTAVWALVLERPQRLRLLGRADSATS